jgi:putative ABC transport system permease protein
MLLITISLLFILLVSSIAIRRAIYVVEETVWSKIPSISTLNLNFIAGALETGLPSWDSYISHGNRPLPNDIIRIGNLEYVKDFNFFLDIQLLSADYDWINLTLDETMIGDRNPLIFSERLMSFSERFQSSAEPFTVRGIHRMIDIETELISLNDGREFTMEEFDNDKQVAMVSQQFLTLNNLEIGSIIELHFAYHRDVYATNQGYTPSDHWLEERFLFYHRILEFEIIGTFDVTQTVEYFNFSTHYQLEEGLVNLSQLYNRIYVPINIVDELTRVLYETRLEYWTDVRGIASDPYHIQEELIHALFLLNNPRDLRLFTNAANEILPGFWEVVDLTDIMGSIITSMDIMLQIADFIFFGGTFFIFLIFSLLLLLQLRERKIEIGIYLALGEQKFKIFLQLLMETFLVSTLGMVMALLVCNIVFVNLSNSIFERILLGQVEKYPNSSWLPPEISVFSFRSMPYYEILELFDVSMSVGMIISMIALCIMIILLSVLFPFFKLIRSNPRNILI